MKDKKPSFLWIVADGFTEFNSSYFTCVVPHNALVKAGYKSRIIHMKNWLDNNAVLRANIATADVIIIQRVLLEETARMIQFVKSQGKKLLVSFDDAYHLIGEENAAFDFWGRGLVEVNYGDIKAKKSIGTHPVEQFKNMLKTVSAGITPSRLLSSDWAPYGAMTYLPNFLESHRYSTEKKKITKKTSIGWGGSLSHLTSFSGSGAQDALREFVPNEDSVIFQLIGDRRLIKQIGLSQNDMIFIDYVMFFDWPSVLASFDIGIAPLSGLYDQRRSRLKVMEYIACGIPFVATKSVVYEDFFDCKSGIFVEQGAQNSCQEENKRGWLAALRKIAANLDECRQVALGEAKRYFPLYDNISNADLIANTLTMENYYELRRK